MKEFEDMQVIWNRQNDEKLYAINEEALHDKIRSKSGSVNRALELLEWIMIGVNLVVALVLAVDAFQDNGAAFEYIMAVAYFGYGLFAIYRRLARRKNEVRFGDTMLGDLDLAIWRVDYLIRQSRTIILWYLLPLLLVFAATTALNGKYGWAIGVPAILLPTTYLASRWEVNRLFMPKKRALEALRETLLAV